MMIRPLQRAALLAIGLAGLLGCDIRLDTGGGALSPTAPGATTITNTNTNTSANTQDRSDTTPTPTPTGGSTGAAALPLPASGEAIVRGIAAANPGLLASSCQDATGESAWAFLDLAIRTLQAADARWGYLCKDASCSAFGRDVVAYRATAADTGIWIVDVIGNHCPGPSDPPAAVRWGVLPFETVRRWAATRR